MIVYIHDACPPEIIGRCAMLLETDRDDDGPFAIVRMLDGAPVEYGDPDGFTVVCTAWGRMPKAHAPRERGPDERLCRWRPREAGDVA